MSHPHGMGTEERSYVSSNRYIDDGMPMPQGSRVPRLPVPSEGSAPSTTLPEIKTARPAQKGKEGQTPRVNKDRSKDAKETVKKPQENKVQVK